MIVLLEFELRCLRGTLLDNLLLLIRSMNICIVWRGPNWAELPKCFLLRLERRGDGTCRGK